MTKWNMVEKKTTSNGKVISTGEKTTPLFDDTDTKKLENKVNTLENKVDKILKAQRNRKIILIDPYRVIDFKVIKKKNIKYFTIGK